MRTLTTAEWLAAAVMLGFGVLFAVLTPPFAVPDETGHWLHAVAASRQASAWHPSERIRVPDPAIDFVDAHAPAGDPGKITKRPRFPIVERQTKRQVGLGSAGAYSGLAYAVPAASLAIARAAGLSTPASFRAGRIANMLAASIVTMIGIRRAKGCKAFLALIALTPMAVALRSSYSADGWILAAAIVIASTGSQVAAWLLAVIKPVVYVPIALACIRRTVAPVVVLIIIAIAAFFWSQRPAGSVVPAGVNAGQQMRYVAAHPLRVSATLGGDLWSNGWQYTREAIGVLGWLQVPLPKAVYVSTLVAALLILLSTTSDAAARTRVIAGSGILAAVALISLGMYLMFMPVGADYVHGIQGRYYLPVLPLLAIVFGRRRALVDERWPLLATAVFSIASLSIALHAVSVYYP